METPQNQPREIVRFRVKYNSGETESIPGTGYSLTQKPGWVVFTDPEKTTREIWIGALAQAPVPEYDVTDEGRENWRDFVNKNQAPAALTLHQR
jgi:hypothetical protein